MWWWCPMQTNLSKTSWCGLLTILLFFFFCSVQCCHHTTTTTTMATTTSHTHTHLCTGKIWFCTIFDCVLAPRNCGVARNCYFNVGPFYSSLLACGRYQISSGWCHMERYWLYHHGRRFKLALFFCHVNFSHGRICSTVGIERLRVRNRHGSERQYCTWCNETFVENQWR